MHVVPGVAMPRPAEAVFEKTRRGFADHLRARRLSKDTVRQRLRIARQVRAVADGYPWEPVWDRALFDRWSAMLADSVAISTMRKYQNDLALWRHAWPIVTAARRTHLGRRR